MIRRILYLLLVTVILGGLAGAIAFYAFDFKPKMLATVILGAPRPPETISAEPARTDTWQPQIAGIGTLTAFQGIDITPQVGGIVTEINFESGEDVHKGKLLVKLDTGDRGSGHALDRGGTRQHRDRADAPRGAWSPRASSP